MYTLPHWGRDKMADNCQTTISNAFSWIIFLELLFEFHWNLFAIDNKPALVQVMAWCRTGDKSFPELICSILGEGRPRGITFNTLIPSQNGRHFADDIFKCTFFNGKVWFPIEIPPKFVPKSPIDNIPTLVQIKSATSHYLNQWWLVYWRICASRASVS